MSCATHFKVKGLPYFSKKAKCEKQKEIKYHKMFDKDWPMAQAVWSILPALGSAHKDLIEH